MHTELTLKQIQREWHGTYKSYAMGFIASLLLTGISFIIVIAEVISGPALIYTLIGLALVQAICQLIFFLHLGQEAKPQWETLIFCFMVLILLIISLGTLWIMNDLNDRLMSGMTKEMAHD
jgi:cytochrome o ubiquinol oxidase operon protein cyoD